MGEWLYVAGPLGAAPCRPPVAQAQLVGAFLVGRLSGLMWSLLTILRPAVRTCGGLLFRNFLEGHFDFRALGFLLNKVGGMEEAEMGQSCV